MPKIRGLVFKKTINTAVWKFCKKVFKRTLFAFINVLSKKLMVSNGNGLSHVHRRDH
jgi:hypothetical protein